MGKPKPSDQNQERLLLKRYRIYAIKRPRRLFKTWPDRPGVCLKPAINRVQAFINGVQFSVSSKLDLLLSLSSSRGWRGGLMVSALDSGSNALGSSLSQGTVLCS